MSQGIIYYNVGTSCLVRLLVSIQSLRRHYDGPIAILSEGDGRICRKIGRAFQADVVPWSPKIAEGRNRNLIAKTKFHEASPYDLSLYLDADTLVIKPLNKIFEKIEEHSFVVTRFGDWTTNQTIIMLNRIKAWEDVKPELIRSATEYGPAINCGMFGFTKDASITKVWEDMTILGRHHRIPDEVACQLLLPKHRHYCMDKTWNRSCRHDFQLLDTKMIHFHGRKHTEGRAASQIWIKDYDDTVSRNVAGIVEWSPLGDKALAEFLASRDFSKAT